MMGLKYVGPKVNISKYGMDFDNNKEDKFVYLNIALQLLKALDHKYVSDKVHIFDTASAHLDQKEVEQMVRHYIDDIDSVTSEAEEAVQHYLGYEIKRAKKNRSLSDDERHALINNLNMMRGYMVQRAINKTVYYAIINRLVDVLKKDNIDYVIAPMFQKFAHVFHSIQGVLQRRKEPIDSNIEIYEEDGRLLTKLDIHKR